MSINKKIGITIDVDAAKATKALDDVSKTAASAEKSAKVLNETLGGRAGTAFKFNEMAAAARNVIGIIQQGAQAIDAWAQRVNRVASVMDNAAVSIDKARTATRGLISDFELQRQANTAALLKVAETDEAFARLSSSAIKLGASIGQGPTQSVESMLVALGRGSTEMLDNLGITLKQEQAHKLYAAQLGVTTDRLTEVQRAEAFRVIASQKILEAADQMTVATERSTDAVVRLKAQLENLTDGAGEWIAQDLSSDLDELSRRGGLLGDEIHGVKESMGLAAEETKGFSTALGESMRAAVAAANAYRNIGNELTAINEDARLMASKIVDKERLRDIERELTLHGTRRDRQAEVNRLLNEQAELKAKSLELEGKMSEAEEVRFQNELRQIRTASASSRGRGKNQWEGTEIGSMGSRGSGIATAADRATFEEQMGGVSMARAGKGAQKSQDDFKIKQLEERTKRMNEFDQFSEAQLEAEKRRLKEEAAATKEAEEAKRREIAETLRKRQQVMQASQQIATSTISLGALAADAFIKGEKRREAAAQRAAGIQSITIGILETVKAVAAFAGFNYVEGAAHTAAAALAYAQGGVLLAKAGSGGGGRAANSGFAAGSAFGPGDTGPAANGPSGSGANTPTAPISEQGVQRSGRGGMHGGTANQQQGRGDTYQITVLGSMSQRDVINLRRQLDDSKGVTRRVGHRG